MAPPIGSKLPPVSPKPLPVRADKPAPAAKPAPAPEKKAWWTAGAPKARPSATAPVKDEVVTAVAAAPPKPKPAAAATADRDAVYTKAKEALATGWTDWKVTEKDVKAVHGALEGLSMDDYQATLTRLDQDGLLDKYVGAMEPEARDAFLDQAKRKGFLGRVAGEKPTTTKFDPPSTPAMYVQTGTVPKAVRQAMHDSNRSAVAGYDQAYRGYLGRYEGAVQGAKSGKEVRELGAPMQYPANSLGEPGLNQKHPDFRAFNEDWLSHASHQPDAFEAWKAVSDKMSDLTGETRAGTFWLKAEAEVVTRPKELSKGLGKEGGPHAKGGVELRKGYEAQLGQDGKLEVVSRHAVGVYAEVEGGKGKGEVAARVEANSKGEVERQVGVELAAPGGAGVGVELTDQRELELTIKLSENLGSYSKGNPVEGTMEGGVTGKLKLDEETEVEARVGVGMKGISQKEVRVAIAENNPGAFGDPPERAAGVKWDQLPEARKEIYEANGWTKQEWEGK